MIKRKTIISSIELGENDLFLALGNPNSKKTDVNSLKLQITSLQEENGKQKNYIDYLTKLLDNKEKEISKQIKCNNTNLKIKNNIINILINTLKMHNISCNLDSVTQVAKSMLQSK